MKKRKAGFVIIFFGYNHKIEKLVERFNQLEHKQSVQIMGDILELNSFNTEELNTQYYGTPNDFSLFECRLYIKNNAVHIHCNVEQPNEFVSNVCAKYDVNGVIKKKYGKEVIKSDCEGNLTYLTESEKNENWYKKDREDFLEAALRKVRNNTSLGWHEVKRTYNFLPEKDLEKILNEFTEVYMGSLF